MQTQREVIREIQKFKGNICVTMLIGDGTLFVKCVKQDLIATLTHDPATMDATAFISTSIEDGEMFIHPNHGR